MTSTDPSLVLDLALSLLPALVGLVGLCLVGRFPRPRGVAVSGLILLTLAPLVDVFLSGATSGVLVSAGLVDVSIALSFLGTLLLAVALVLLAVAATRGPQEAPHRPHGGA